jgi:hypothetical protein
MKTKLVLFLFVGFIYNVFAQQYTPMLEIGKIWNMHHYDNLIPPNNSNFDISLDNLVTVGGTEYFQTSNGNLFREDIANKKVYRLVNSVEELILDFDLNIGDNLISPLIFIDDGSFSRTITTIGVATFYGIPNLKYYQTDCGETIIEGIGVQSRGLFDRSTSCSTLDTDSGDLLVNMQLLSNADFFIQNDIRLFYDSNLKQLKLTNQNNDNISLKLYSVLGKKVIDSPLNSDLDVSQLQKGIYFYTISKDNSTKKGKVFIF